MVGYLVHIRNICKRLWILSFAKNMDKNIGKNMSKKMTGRI